MKPPRCRFKVPIPGTDMFQWCGNAAERTEQGPRCPQHTAPAHEPKPHGQRTRAIINAQRLSLDRQERHDLAQMLVHHHGSWATLSEPDARRIADALDAFLIVQALILLRSKGARGGR